MRRSHVDVSSATFAYPQQSGEVRAELAERLTRAGTLDSGFVLSTCLRIEVTVPGPHSSLDNALQTLFGNLPDDIRPRIRQGDRAVTHLFRVAAGLESPILGEQEILTQFRQTVLEAEAAGAAEGLFAGLLETAVSVGRQARDLIPGSPHNSMAAVAAQTIGSASRVAVLGWGIMATISPDQLDWIYRLSASTFWRFFIQPGGNYCGYLHGKRSRSRSG